MDMPFSLTVSFDAPHFMNFIFALSFSLLHLVFLLASVVVFISFCSIKQVIHQIVKVSINEK